MQVVELYISDTRVDLFKDESVTITDTITTVSYTHLTLPTKA